MNHFACCLVICMRSLGVGFAGHRCLMPWKGLLVVVASRNTGSSGKGRKAPFFVVSSPYFVLRRWILWFWKSDYKSLCFTGERTTGRWKRRRYGFWRQAVAGILWGFWAVLRQFFCRSGDLQGFCRLISRFTYQFFLADCYLKAVFARNDTTISLIERYVQWWS